MMLLTLIHFITSLIALSEAKAQNGDTSNILDFRKQGLVTKVKNQGDCGAGGAFAIIGLIEGQYAKKYGELVDFSAQELIDCLNECGGCSYCDAETTLYSLKDLGGLQQEEDYPFIGKKQRCHYKPAISKVRVTDYTIHKLKCEKKLEKLLKDYGPIYIAIDGDALHEYKGNGVLPSCPYKQTNHAVLLIGYGTKNGEDYWLIKNSWGASWGNKGYAKIPRGVNACGLLNAGAVTVKIDT